MRYTAPFDHVHPDRLQRSRAVSNRLPEQELSSQRVARVKYFHGRCYSIGFQFFIFPPFKSTRNRQIEYVSYPILCVGVTVDIFTVGRNDRFDDGN